MSQSSNYSYDEEHLNKSNLKEGEHIYTNSEDEKVLYRHNYVNGELVDAINYQYSVEGKSPLVGKYKNGEPFEGYFVLQSEMEVPMIDHYIGGVIQSQHSMTLLDLLKSEEENYYNIERKFIKSEFKNGKPWHGMVHDVYHLKDGVGIFSTEFYTDGVIKKVELWIMAMHYAEMIKLDFLPDGYKIYKEPNYTPHLEEDHRERVIEVHFSDNESGNVALYLQNKEAQKYSFFIADVEKKLKPKKSLVMFFLDEKSCVFNQKFEYSGNEKIFEEAIENNAGLISQIYLGLSTNLISNFSTLGSNDYSQIFELYKGKPSQNMLFLDDNGKPIVGLLVENDVNPNTYKYSHFKDSKLIDSKSNVNHEELSKILYK